ncbi:MAG: chemotaxis protein CheW [Zoogloeaceae bacterium]|nr:chemotaxis protein CheW [Zoogloeaceae bacterium]
MTIDMSQFYQVFFEEAAEHLASMESLLLALDLDNPEAEDLNAIFRAAHSIKGSSGTFGFSDMADVTHVLETMLDKIRKGEAAMTSDMLDASLVAGDVLKNLLAAHRGEEEADEVAAAKIRERLEKLCAAMEPGVVTSAAESKESGSASPQVSRFDVSFVPDGPVAQDQGQLMLLLGESDGIYGVELLEPGPDGAWRLRIDGNISAEKLSSLMEFVARSGTVAVCPADQALKVESAYGFFADEESVSDGQSNGESNSPSEASDQSWGLFDAAAFGSGKSPVVRVADENEAYGFFDSIVVEPSYSNELKATADLPRETLNAGQSGFGVKPAGSTESSVGMAKVAPIVAAEAKKISQERPGPKPAAKAAAGDNSIRVSVDKVDQMINLVGELVITQAMLQQSASTMDPVIYERLLQGLSQLERNTRDLQESVMSIRMLPISVVFTRFPRVVRDLSQKLGKKVELKTLGEGTELDKGLIERITDPLTHLVRNSLDHGIEMPEKRKAAGKSETGTITLRASHQSGNIVIEVSDDGAGLNRDKILGKARERGLSVSDSMTDSEVWQLIFEPGFSTADQVTEVSGRGVGMDVVKKNIAAMGGKVEIESVFGVGTRMTVRLPLTLAILDGMSIAVGDETYVIPLNYIVESLQPSPGQIRTMAGSESVIQVRGEYLPVIPLHKLFGCNNAVHDYGIGIMIVVESDGSKAALFVDGLLGQHQVVIKSLEANFRRVQGISGATIMGDGKVALIIDVGGTLAMARGLRAAA